MINKADGSCKCFSGAKYASLQDHSVCLDPFYDVLWSYSPVHQEVCCFNVVSHETRHLCKKHPQLSCILGPDLAVPVHEGAKTTRSHAALHLLACLDTLTNAQRLGLTVSATEKEKRPLSRVYTKEDYAVVNRFESGHAIKKCHKPRATRRACHTEVSQAAWPLGGHAIKKCHKPRGH
ncbi:hypothetical protein NP493_330g03064 [Ridgeia piscesae]|uniref:Uncharacterized protein n=1 Tax=Ridgeia piscesae TaxID=27915 RepID=A0AAD9L4K5_RIDPI|nr:hypothetical protein NP493_330g03064 [Ridgeia piscesae]